MKYGRYGLIQKVKLLAVLIVLMVMPCTGFGQDLLRMGVLPVVDTLPLFAGLEKGDFAGQGIDLQIIPFQSALERDAALQAGRLDGYFGDILNTVLLIRAGQRLGIATTAFHTHPRYRMFALVSAPGSGIDDLGGLQNKSVAISRATIIEYLLDRMLMEKALPAGFVEKMEIKKMPIRLQMLLAGRVPAALLPEPLVTLAVAKGARVLADDRSLNTAVTVLALTRSWAAAKPDRLQRFLAAYSRAVDRINGNPEAFKPLLIAKTRIPKAVEDQYRVPAFPPVALPAAADIRSAQDWLGANRIGETSLSYDDIVLKQP